MGVQLPSEPITRKEQYLAKAAGQAVEIPAEPITREEAYLEAIANAGGGGGGTTNYNQLFNKPQIAGTTLQGNKTLSDLGIASASALANKVDKVDGKDLSSNDYSDTEKQKNADNATAISAIKDGATIDSFADVESALSNKQDTLTFDDVPTANSNNPVKSGGVKSAIDAAVASAYHHAGTKTCAELVAGLLVAANEGNVYNMTDSGTTTADFIEGAGQPIKAGDNVGIAKISDGVYKFDLLSGFVDTTNFVQKSQTAGLLNNDGTVNTTIEGTVAGHTTAIAGVESNLTDLDNEVNGNATVYPYADVITIEDAVPANVADCNVKIEPVQDLHGQSAPYVGGAGKNKLPLTVDSIKALNSGLTWNGNTAIKGGVPFTILTDSDNNVLGIKALGTSTAQIWYFNVAHITTTETLLFNTGNTYSWDANKIVCEITDGTNTYHASTLNGVEVPAGTYDVVIAAQNNATVDVTFLPMLRTTTETDATFAPYTNYCPITGHTEASVLDEGKNLISAIEQGGFGNDGADSSATNRLRSDGYISVIGGSKYTVSNSASLQTAVFYWDEQDVTTPYQSSGWQNSPYTFEVPVNAKYVRIMLRKSDNSDLTPSDTDNIQIEYGEAATAYTPYVAPHTYTITLGDTIYGGTVDFDSGVMTVTHKFVEFDGSEDEDWYYSADPYNRAYITINDIKAVTDASVVPNLISNYLEAVSKNTIDNSDGIGVSSQLLLVRLYSVGVSSLSDFKTYISNNNLEICYELATPTTIQLTPQQIQLLQGQNTLTASTGQISVTANGVSGAIGAVQEQVNDHEERIETVESGLNDVGSYTPISSVRIGTYYDGRPIYRMVVAFGALPNATGKATQSLGLGSILPLEMHGVAYSASQNTAISVPNASATELTQVWFDNTYCTLGVTTNWDASALDECNIILTYVPMTS